MHIKRYKNVFVRDLFNIYSVINHHDISHILFYIIQGTNPQAMEFFPGARNTAAPPPGNIKEFLPRNPTGPPPPGPPPPGPPPTSVPPPEFLPNNLSADFPPLRAAQHTQPPPSGPPPPGPGQSNEIADFPEFVPRSIAAALAGHSQVPPHLRNSTAGTTSLGTLGPGGMHNSGEKYSNLLTISPPHLNSILLDKMKVKCHCQPTGSTKKERLLLF